MGEPISIHSKWYNGARQLTILALVLNYMVIVTAEIYAEPLSASRSQICRALAAG